MRTKRTQQCREASKVTKLKVRLREQEDNNLEDDNFSEKEIGRIYELKKLYARLLAILQYLRTSTDPALIALGNKVERVVDLFQLLADNLEKYVDDIDDIIVSLYQFVGTIYKFMAEYAKTHEI